VISINNKCTEATIHKLSTIQWILLPVQPFVVWPISGACIKQPHIFSLFVTFQKHGIRIVYTGPNLSLLKKIQVQWFCINPVYITLKLSDHSSVVHGLCGNFHNTTICYFDC
jgi:hypothetical protein